jgi:predicted GTPase
MSYIEDPVEKMILAMGVTGAGKSYFVRKLTEGLEVKVEVEVEVGSALQSRKSALLSNGPKD